MSETEDFAPQCWLDAYLCPDEDCCEHGACEHLRWEFQERNKRIAALEVENAQLRADLKTNAHLLAKAHDTTVPKAEVERLTASHSKELKDAREYAKQKSEENARLQEENAELRSMRRFGKVVSVVKCQQCGAWEDGAYWRGMCRNCYIERLREALENEAEFFESLKDDGEDVFMAGHFGVMAMRIRAALEPDKEAKDEKA